ncbi:site-2 protease family protein [Marinitenerispora sediminis]|uniref:Site-2 protease family protein n=1 Tax=Marinitenerispora sediminis TaxID=1931232 RepID=A0A368T5Z8_9ACTN|nr:site-2 protease family protein [Marinitenerispora sediminis]RCV48328.1 site-2 protease family protein [Marinitenerispora sediminis]RCV52242.1 site-2 protease family protein [Marinitenerispora sediminis]RCV59052.1 site-2 protease family protein [Marinitenerispora sediminis]
MSTPEPTERDESAETSTAGDVETAERTGTAAEDSGTPPRARAADGWALLPSPVFVLLLGVTGLAGWFSWTRAEEDWSSGSTVYAPFVLILGAWIVVVALHEFAHAVLAYRFGDRALRGGGYLRLNPFRYREMFAGLLLPVAYLVLGGFGMTGPAVHLDRAAVPVRWRRSLVALAGIAANLVVAVVLGLAVGALVPAGAITNNYLLVGLMYVCFLSMTAALVNLLPLPGLDGFDVIAPFLPERLARLAHTAGIFGSIAVFALLWFPPVNTAFLDLMYRVMELVGPNRDYIGFGQLLFQFWVG